MLSFVERCAVGHATGLSLRIVVAGDLTLIYDGSLHENQQGNNNTQAARAATGAAARASTTKPSNKRYQAAAFQRHITSISCIIISITIVPNKTASCIALRSLWFHSRFCHHYSSIFILSVHHAHLLQKDNTTTSLNKKAASVDHRRRQTTDDRTRQTTLCGVWEFCF